MNNKIVYIDNQPTKYLIFEDGSLKNIETNKFLKGTINGNYRNYVIRFNNKGYHRKAHRLVAEAFLENVENLPVVHHKNGDTLDNHISNLEWVSYEKNNSEFVQHEPKFSYVLEENQEDIWKPFRNSYYLISQTGKIKNAHTNTLLKGSIDQYGYKYFHLHSTINKNIWVHRAVFECFGGNLIDGLVINHKDGNKLNNHINNLEQVTPAYNRQHSLEQLHPELKTMVHQFDKAGNYLATFSSINECARLLNLDSRHIANCINDKIASVKGYVFCDSLDGFDKRKHKPVQQIGQYSLDGQLLNVYESITDASRKTGFSSSNIKNCLSGQYKTANGFKWKRI